MCVYIDIHTYAAPEFFVFMHMRVREYSEHTLEDNTTKLLRSKQMEDVNAKFKELYDRCVECLDIPTVLSMKTNMSRQGLAGVGAK